MEFVSESRTGDQVRVDSPHLGYPYLGEPYLTEGSLTSPAWQGLWAGTVGRIATESDQEIRRVLIQETWKSPGTTTEFDPAGLQPGRVVRFASTKLRSMHGIDTAIRDRIQMRLYVDAWYRGEGDDDVTDQRVPSTSCGAV